MTLWAYRNGICTVDNNDALTSGELQESKCNGNAEGVGGCATIDTVSGSFGTKFNSNGGGVYAVEKTSEFVRVFFIPRSEVAALGDSGPLGSNPNPNTWGKAMAHLSGGCDLDATFHKLKMIFNITFCGDMGAALWDSDEVCRPKANTCEGK